MASFFQRSLSFHIIMGTLAGVACGLFFGDLCSVFEPWASTYIMILKVTTIPYLICAVIHGVGSLSPGSAKNLLGKGAMFLACIWAINIGTIYTIVYLFPSGKGAAHAVSSTLKPSKMNFAELIIPENIFTALSSNLIPAIVVFGLLVGIALMHMRERQPFMGMIENCVKFLTQITGWISRITPVGTFIIIAERVGSIQPATLKQLGTYLVLYMLGLSILALWVLPRVVEMFSSIPYRKWLSRLAPLMLVAFTTNLVIVVLPFLIELIQREIEEERHRRNATITDQVQGIVSVAFNLPLGSMFMALFIFFVATFYNIPLSMEAQVQLFITTGLTSLGAVGLGSWINSLNFLLHTLNLPLAAVDTYLTTLPLTAGFQSMIAVMEVGSLALLTALSCHGFLRWKWGNFFKQVVLIALVVVPFVAVFKHWVRLPPIANPSRGIETFFFKPLVDTHVYSVGDILPSPRQGDAMERVITSGVLRVGYNSEAIPFCFLNEQGTLAGYDMMFAQFLARDLGCRLELIPLNLATFSEELKQGLYDIAMSSVTINEGRIKKAYFSNPYLESNMSLTMHKKFKKQYTSLEILEKDPHVKVVVRRGTSYEQVAKSLLPASKIVVIDNYSDYITHYPDAVLLRGEPQSIAWSLNHPDYAIVTPKQFIAKDVFGYALGQGEDRLLTYLNVWLDLKKNEKVTEQQFKIWVLGQEPQEKQPSRRWSIIRNVLGWTEN